MYKRQLLESAAKAPKTAMKDVWLKSKEKAVSECKETPFASQQGETSNAVSYTHLQDHMGVRRRVLSAVSLPIQRRLFLQAVEADPQIQWPCDRFNAERRGASPVRHLSLIHICKLLNGNSFRLGVSGSGKSFSAKEEIVSIALSTDDEDVYKRQGL